jgi:hypothetical protein
MACVMRLVVVLAPAWLSKRFSVTAMSCSGRKSQSVSLQNDAIQRRIAFRPRAASNGHGEVLYKSTHRSSIVGPSHFTLHCTTAPDV